MSPAEDYQLAVRSLGAVTWYLQSCHLEQQLLSMRHFEHYVPLDSVEGAKLPGLNGRHMVRILLSEIGHNVEFSMELLLIVINFFLPDFGWSHFEKS